MPVDSGSRGPGVGAGAVESAVLHALRLGGVLPTDSVAARAGLNPRSAAATLRHLEEASMVLARGGSLPGWSLTASGRARGEQLLAAELDEMGAREAVADAYARFLELNPELLVICTDWQVRPGGSPPVLNDHSDPAYDSAVLERLVTLHARTVTVLEALEEALGRFAGYQDRLAGALESALRGESDWVTRPVVDSYHTVWFELHEDLLATLGRRRGEDDPGRAGASPRTPSIPAGPTTAGGPRQRPGPAG